MTHPSYDDLAAFADGVLPADRADTIREHLASCAMCLGAYSDALELRTAEAVEVPPELIARAAHVPLRPSAAASLPRRRMSPVRIAWAGAAMVVVVVGAWGVVTSMRSRDQFGGVDLTPFRASALAMSASVRDQLVVPGGETWADRAPATVVRSGSPAMPPSLPEAVERLATARFPSAHDRAEAGRWLGVGYLALDDLTSARIALDAALAEAPAREELLVLAAARAHRSGETAAAEDYLRRALTAHPHSALVRLDLGIVLSTDPGRRNEARVLLSELTSTDHGPLTTRAWRVLDDME
jgi:tetratricopeptide (TPR) repeat protein